MTESLTNRLGEHQDCGMPSTVVEIHVPLTPTPGLPEYEYPFPWIDRVEDFLAVQDRVGGFDDGEEFGDVYIFFISGASEQVLLETASRVAKLDFVPAGTFAMVTTEEAEMGCGRRVELPT